VAVATGVPLYRHFAGLLGGREPRLPVLTINLFSGGKHAGKQIAIQDVLLVPVAATTVGEGLAAVYAIYQAAADLTLERYGMRLLRADEGGLAPPFESTEAMLTLAVESIKAAGYVPGREVALAVDVASTHFYADGRYMIDDASLDSAAMIQRLRDWTSRYPIVSIEDGLAEEDWSHWPALVQAIGHGQSAEDGAVSSKPALATLVMGDDFLCTNPERIRRAIEIRAATALLLKVNQIGTLTEAAEACRLARAAGWTVVVSARSGETEDDWLADLAVAWGDQIKIGSITQSERLAKYNRLLEIENEHELL
jgi:enolase